MAHPDVRRIHAGDALVAHSTLRRVDHVDAHSIRIDCQNTTPEQWAREILEHVPRTTRMRLHRGWAMLGLKLDHDDPAAVAGWTVSESNANFVRLHATSRLGLTGQLVVRMADEGFEFATFAQLTNVGVRAIWAAVLPGHLDTVASLLSGAVDRARA